MTLRGKRGELKEVEEKETVVKMYCMGEESIFNKKYFNGYENTYLYIISIKIEFYYFIIL